MRFPRLFRAAHLTTVLFLIVALVAPAAAAPAVFNGDTVSSTLPTFNILAYGGKGDDTTDNCTALTNAMNAVQTAGGGTIYYPRGTYLFGASCAIVLPNTTSNTWPVQVPMRWTGDGAAWDTQLGFQGQTQPGSSILDIRYSGATYNAKINTFGTGVFEIDHLTLEDNGTDSVPFVNSTNTAIVGHDDAFYGNPGHTGQTSNQDAWVLGQNGYTASSASITSGTATLTIGGGDPPFNASMVGFQVGIPGAGTSGGYFSSTIKTYVSPTQVTLNNNASTTVTTSTAYYFGIGADKNAAFEGFGTKLYHNIYNRIRRGVTFNMYSNGVEVSDEFYSETSGSNETYAAPYYFSGVPGFVDDGFGIKIRGGTIEVANYKYVAALTQNNKDELFDGIAMYDPNGYFVSEVYSGASTAPGAAGNSTVIAAHMDTTGTKTYATGPTAASIGVITNESGGGASSFPNNIVVGGGASTTSGTISSLSGTTSNLFLNNQATSAGTSAVYVNFNSGANNTSGLYVYDGGATNYTRVSPSSGIITSTGSTYGLNAIIAGSVSASAHTSCSSSSGIPCEALVTCSISSATTCTANATVPATAICLATADSADTTTGAEWIKMGAVSTNTQPVIFNVAASQTSTAAAVVHCL